MKGVRPVEPVERISPDHSVTVELMFFGCTHARASAHEPDGSEPEPWGSLAECRATGRQWH